MMMIIRSQNSTRDLESVQERIFEKVPETRRLWDEAQPGLRIALMLVRLRRSKGISQSEIAKRAGWNKSFVSRLESGLGGIPDLSTLMRYIEACGASGALVVGSSEEDQQFHVVDAVTLSEPLEAQEKVGLEALRDKDILLEGSR